MVRGRCGAIMWQLYEDVSHPDGWLELWSMESWTDHLRETARMAPEDLTVLARVDSYRSETAERLTQRFIAVATHPARRHQEVPLRNVR